VTREAFLAVPLVVDRQVFGLIYGDRLPSGRSLDEESLRVLAHSEQPGVQMRLDVAQARAAEHEFVQGGHICGGSAPLPRDGCVRETKTAVIVCLWNPYAFSFGQVSSRPGPIVPPATP
jgi:hypothetical protein